MILAGRRAGLVTTALILSVGVNMFAAAAWGTHEFKRSKAQSRGYGIERIVRTAPEEVRHLVEADFEAVRPEIRERMGQIRDARADLARLMRDPGTDKEAITEAFAELRRRYGDVALLVHTTLIDAALEMRPELRAEWAEEWGSGR